MTTNLPTKLSELDRLKMVLAKERQGRLQAEAAHLQMLQRQLQAQHSALEGENKTLFEELKTTYNLNPGDEIAEDGTIKRTPQPPAKE
jgi:hypothetical protein